MSTTTGAPTFDVGVYTIPEATRILSRDHGVSRRNVSAWLIRGETYGRFQAGDGTSLLTFSDLVSLKVVAKLRDEGVSSQRVRKLERRLRDEFPDLMQPFAAVGIYFTDGQNLWAATDPQSDHVIEIVGKRPDQFVIERYLRPFVSEIRVDEDGVSPESWQLARNVEMNPRVQFGRPVVEGTRLPIRTVLANLEAGSVAEVAGWFGLTEEQVASVQEFALAA